MKISTVWRGEDIIKGQGQVRLGWDLENIEEIRSKNENFEEQIIFREQDKQRMWEDSKIKGK